MWLLWGSARAEEPQNRNLELFEVRRGGEDAKGYERLSMTACPLFSFWKCTTDDA
jgi:hypothetical protein